VGLVGRLVGGEADVTVQAEDRALGIAHELGRELGEAAVHLVHETGERPADVLLVVLAMSFEPGLGVVAREPAEERERLRTEVLHREPPRALIRLPRRGRMRTIAEVAPAVA
jgi:hypothetical protein